MNLMQRMSDMLTRWLDGSLRRRDDDQHEDASLAVDEGSNSGSSDIGADDPRLEDIENPPAAAAAATAGRSDGDSSSGLGCLQSQNVLLEPTHDGENAEQGSCVPANKYCGLQEDERGATTMSSVDDSDNQLNSCSEGLLQDGSIQTCNPVLSEGASRDLKDESIGNNVHKNDDLWRDTTKGGCCMSYHSHQKECSGEETSCPSSFPGVPCVRANDLPFFSHGSQGEIQKTQAEGLCEQTAQTQTIYGQASAIGTKGASSCLRSDNLDGNTSPALDFMLRNTRGECGENKQEMSERMETVAVKSKDVSGRSDGGSFTHPQQQQQQSVHSSCGVGVSHSNTVSPDGSLFAVTPSQGSMVAATRLEPIISLHYSHEGTTASTIRVGYASFDVNNPPLANLSGTHVCNPLSSSTGAKASRDGIQCMATAGTEQPGPSQQNDVGMLADMPVPNSSMHCTPELVNRDCPENRDLAGLSLSSRPASLTSVQVEEVMVADTERKSEEESWDRENADFQPDLSHSLPAMPETEVQPSSFVPQCHITIHSPVSEPETDMVREESTRESREDSECTARGVSQVAENAVTDTMPGQLKDFAS